MRLTVKELKEILNGCNDDAEIIIQDDLGISEIHDSQIFASNDGKQVIFDITYDKYA